MLKKFMKKSIIIKTLAIVLVAAVMGVVCNKNFVKSKADSKQSFSDDTVVTEDNILGILDSLNIEHGEIEYVDGINMEEYTVADLKKALGGVDFANKKISSSCTKDTVTFKGTFKLNTYLGVGDLGLVKVSSQKIDSKIHWDIDDVK